MREKELSYELYSAFICLIISMDVMYTFKYVPLNRSFLKKNSNIERGCIFTESDAISLQHSLRMLKTPWIRQVLFTEYPCVPILCDCIWAMGHEQEALLGWSIQESVCNALTLFSPAIIQRRACTEMEDPYDTNSLGLCVTAWRAAPLKS